MTDFSPYLYSPAVRTRRAELFGLAHIEDPYGAGLLPLFEVTRSRRTKSNPEGAVEASVKDFLEIVGDARFVIDVTSLASLTNLEVEKLLNPYNSFSNWMQFVEDKLPKTAIPVVHLTEPFDAASVRVQITRFMRRNGAIALRIPSEFENLTELLDVATDELVDLSSVVVYADVGMVTARGFNGALSRVREIGDAVSGLQPGIYAPLASSFPSTVTPFGDTRGLFPLYEVSLSDAVKDEYPDINCVHGDYACIHPRDLEGMAVNWVPRVDVPLDGELFYYRFRRHDGGYVRAAQYALSDKAYVPLSCWADGVIRTAAAGSPEGKAPAFWISARLNFHIERQLVRLGA